MLSISLGRATAFFPPRMHELHCKSSQENFGPDGANSGDTEVPLRVSHGSRYVVLLAFALSIIGSSIVSAQQGTVTNDLPEAQVNQEMKDAGNALSNNQINIQDPHIASQFAFEGNVPRAERGCRCH